MLNSMRPPTDNLYKFAAIFGLVLIGYSVWLFNSQDNKRIESQLIASEAMQEMWIVVRDNEALRSLLHNQMERVRDGETIFGISIEASGVDGVNDEQIASIRRFEIVGQQASVATQLTSYYVIAALLFFLLGVVISIIGFYSWYTKVQIYENMILRKLAEEQVPEEVQDGPANAYRPWDAAEEQKLRDGFVAKKSYKKLAEEHGRTKGAIRSRLIKMGLIEAESKQS